MDLKYQVAIAVSSCCIGVLVGFFIIFIARRSSRRKSFDNPNSRDDANRRQNNLEYRQLKSFRTQDRESIAVPPTSQVKFETFGKQRSKHAKGLPASDEQHVYQTLSPFVNARHASEPPVDYPVTPLVQRQGSNHGPISVAIPHADYSHDEILPDYPVTPVVSRSVPKTGHVAHQVPATSPVEIPQADYSDDETLTDYPVTKTTRTNVLVQPQVLSTGHQNLKRTKTYPAMQHSELSQNTRRSERRFVTGNLIGQHKGYKTHTRPIKGHPADILSQSKTRQFITRTQSDNHVMHVIDNHEAVPLQDFTPQYHIKNVPDPDYH